MTLTTHKPVLGALLLGVSLSCAGTVDDATGSGADGTGKLLPPVKAATLAAPVFRRLTVAQYLNTVRDLTGMGVKADSLEPDSTDGGFRTVGAARVTTSPVGVESYDAGARRLAQLLFRSTTGRAAFVGCDPGPTPATDSCVKTFLGRFGLHVWRRPLSDEEVGRYQDAVAKAALEVDGTVWRGLEMATASLLSSPYFLYRAEIGEPDPSDPRRRRLTDFEIAGRLSYLLWNTTPDDALLEAAARGRLHIPEGLKAEIDRLLGAARAREAMVGFFTEWLGVDRVGDLGKDQAAFPAFSPALAAAMQTEIELTVADMAFDRDADFVAELFEGRDTFVNGQLGSLYGLSGSQDRQFVKAKLPADGPRAGFLTSAAFLAKNARATMTSPTLRGQFIRERLLCSPVPPPPPNAKATLPPPAPGTPETTRQRLERHRTDPSCAACHERMDPLGLALEPFDGIGAYRTTDAGMVIDARGSIDGKTFDGPRQLGSVMRADARTTECVARQLYRHAVGRIESDDQEGAVPAIAAQWRDAGLRWGTLLGSLSQSDGFRFTGPLSE